MGAVSDRIVEFIEKYLYWMSFPKIQVTDIIEIIIISIVVYQVFKWIRKTRAWSLLKGFTVIMVFMLIAAILQFNTIIWLFTKLINVGIIAIVIVFQPELRRALEQLGRSNILASFVLDSDRNKDTLEHMSTKTVNEIIKATFEMAKYKTGALIVLEQDVALGEYERTGISIDAAVSSQLIINIFEKNTPLHDGAVIIRNDRVCSATCYLPLTENPDVDKKLGTRHRAALGISEVSDSLTIVVSEETGNVSVVYGGEIYRNCEPDDVKKKIEYLRKKKIDVNKFKIWKGRMKKSESKKENN
ncbi:MAG: diadenylate cyclase CdaA [Lachnospiraceae bacterium]|nr:diadenylate cyclase CdaA [Lachnospiraceae bacterium]